MSSFDFDMSSFLSCFGLITGPSGSGKTTLGIRTLCGQEFTGKDDYGRDTWSEPVMREYGEKIIVIAVENGLLSVMDLLLNKDADGNPAPYFKAVKADSYEKIVTIIRHLNRDKVKEEYKYVLFDGITDLSYAFYAAARTDTGTGYNKHLEQYSFSMQGVIRTMRDLPHYYKWVTCVLDASQSNKKDEAYGKSFEVYGQQLSVDMVKKDFDTILELDTSLVDNEGSRLLKASPSSQYEICKDRSGQLMPVEPFNLDLITKKMTRQY